MRRSVSGCLLAVAAVVSACSDFKLEPVPSGPEIPMARLRAEPYSFTFHSDLNEADRLVIRDEAAWQSLWNQIHQSGTRPSFDFSREMLVVAAMGSRPTGGYGIVFEGANEHEPNGIALRVLSSSPGNNCLVTTALTAPVDIAVVPLHPGPVRFFERSVTTNCE